ncbi:MAG: biotin--[acetyl-CoA-carboxylase] ligase [Culturomica sp.]|jgi:BirA family biotin operon repressor/biotin-[acetyl-CoA-carboxylase] ligase|nr:biotin--[acetyl-CoA-carboxylase] ligase [Culturomica sp.]
MKTYGLNGFLVHKYKELISTNSKAAEYGYNEIQDKTLIITPKQTGGRGQGTNKWESETGKNLAFSMIFKPEQSFSAVNQFAISMAVSLACRNAISAYADDCTIKWPNDIYVGDYKIGGILIENKIVSNYVMTSVCGVGLNVNQKLFSENIPNPISLYMILDKELPLKKLLSEILDNMNITYPQIYTPDYLLSDYLSVLYRREGLYKWRDVNGMFLASIEGVDEYGRLVLTDTRGEQRVYGFKEVEYIIGDKCL